MARIRLALSQMDTVVGDVRGNVRRIASVIEEAASGGADVVAFPELAVTGYPPEDLLLKPGFIADNVAGVKEVASVATRCVALVGFVDVDGHDFNEAVTQAAGFGNVAREAAVRGAQRRLRNAVAVCSGGRVVGVYHKRRLPNYGVFDEDRWFAPGTGPLELFGVGGVPVGVSICEDLWFPDGPVAQLGRGGARLVVNVNASPYAIGRVGQRLAVLCERAAQAGCPIAYVNQVGGQDELVFDGASMVVSAGGDLLARAPAYREELVVLDVETDGEADTGSDASGDAVDDIDGHASRIHLPVVLATPSLSSKDQFVAGVVAPPMSLEEEVYGALVLGTRDYLEKNGFSSAVIGLSGGIDSSLVATIAVDALGPDNVYGLSMPSRYSSEGSVTDARLLARNLGIEIQVVPIEPAHRAYEEMLLDLLCSAPKGLTDENLQSRIRGVLLMAVSNAFGRIVLTTGNKSELAVGYSTLYGDSAGGFAVIKDVPKTLVYRLCRYRNEKAGFDLVPRSVLEKAPSAELRPDQRDDQSLPPYEVLDPILAELVEHDRSVADVAAQGFDPGLVASVARLVDLAEYKRRQSPPGVRITAKAFGKDRRMPITNRYRPELDVVG